MYNLPQFDVPLNRGSAENPSISTRFSVEVVIPSDIRHKRIFDRIHSPAELDGAGFDPIVRYVWVALDRSCREPGRYPFGTWKTNKTLLEMIREIFGIEYKDRACTVALKKLEAFGYVRRDQDAMVEGQRHRMIWCLWRLPDDLAGCDVNVGGVDLPAEECSPVPAAIRKSRVSLPAEGAKIRPEAAIKCARIVVPRAQKTADNSGIELRDLTLTLTDAPLGGTTEEPAEAPTGASEGGPPSAERVAEARAMLAGPVAGVVALALPYVYVLKDAGLDGEVPARYRGDKCPPRPPVVPARAVAGPRPVPPASALPVRPGVGDLKPETLILRLVELGEDQVGEAIGRVAGYMAYHWDDFGSINCFKKRLSEVRARAIPPEAFLKAFRAGERARPGPDTKPGYRGRIFNQALTNRGRRGA